MLLIYMLISNYSMVMSSLMCHGNSSLQIFLLDSPSVDTVGVHTGEFLTLASSCLITDIVLFFSLGFKSFARVNVKVGTYDCSNRSPHSKKAELHEIKSQI